MSNEGAAAVHGHATEDGMQPAVLSSSERYLASVLHISEPSSHIIDGGHYVQQIVGPVRGEYAVDEVFWGGVDEQPARDVGREDDRARDRCTRRESGSAGEDDTRANQRLRLGGRALTRRGPVENKPIGRNVSRVGQGKVRVDDGVSGADFLRLRPGPVRILPHCDGGP